VVIVVGCVDCVGDWFLVKDIAMAARFVANGDWLRGKWRRRRRWRDRFGTI